MFYITLYFVSQLQIPWQYTMNCEIMLVTIIFFILSNIIGLVTAQTLHKCNTTYRANLDAVLPTLPTNMDRYGFYNGSVGTTPDRANVIGICRGDLELDDCRKCVQQAAVDIGNSSCSGPKQGITWSNDDECLVRHSNQTIFGTLATNLTFSTGTPENASNPYQFARDLGRLLGDIRTKAVNGSHRKFAVGNITGPDSQTIFALVQCTQDLRPEDCDKCLINAAEQIPQRLDGARGGKILLLSCYIRYEIFNFFIEARQQVPPTSVNPTTPPAWSSEGEHSNKTRVIIILVSIISASVILAVFIGTWLRMRGKQDPTQQLETAEEINTPKSLQYDFNAIRSATNDFSDSNKLGEGGFGAVYKGILSNGQNIAIKRLSKDSKQGSLEFKNEVLLLSRLQHRNLVNLLGFSIEGTEKLLIYEYVSNGSLNNFIFDPIKHPRLDWKTRYKIIEGIARGLLYLHENSRFKIIHRDIKPSNILLEEEMNPKIADFGMARLFGQDENEGNTRTIVGTYGYIPPEYARNGRFSVKSDVYSFGVLVLEIISGQKNYNYSQNGECEVGLLSSVWKNWRGGTPVNVVDPFLRSSSESLADIQRCIHIGLLCCQRNACKRPTTASVVQMLSGNSNTLAVPYEPAFYFRSTEHMSENDVSITELHPR